MMNAKELKKFLVKYRNSREDGQAWLDGIPRDISTAFFDNTLIQSLEYNNTLLMKALFGDLYEDISWFLDEWTPERGKFTMPDEKSYDIQDVDDYIFYLLNEGLVGV